MEMILRQMWKQFMQDKVFSDPYQHRFFNKGGLKDLFAFSKQDFTTMNMVHTANADLAPMDIDSEDPPSPPRASVQEAEEVPRQRTRKRPPPKPRVIILVFVEHILILI